MSKDAFDKIAAGMAEAIDVARGKAKPARTHIPADIDVKALRRKMKMSQEAFASHFGFSLTQIRDWEQGRTRPLDAMRAYLTVIEQAPETIMGMLQAAQKCRHTEAA